MSNPATPGTQPVPHVVAEHHANAVVFWAGDQQLRGTVHARGFLPRRSYPIAVMAADGSITRITDDPLPGQDVLARHLAQLQPALNPLTLAEVDRLVGDDDIVAIDVSGSTFDRGPDEDRARTYANHFAARGIRVAMFDGAGVADYAGKLEPGGGGDLNALFTELENDQRASVLTRNVFVLTDGLVRYVLPRCPVLWTWLITPGGDAWMSRRKTNPMTTHFVQ